eukprot:scaffold33832_cov38-Attheya_sp.AAC.2
MDTPPAPTAPMATADLSARVPHTDPSLITSYLVRARRWSFARYVVQCVVHAVTSLVDINVCGGKVLLVVKTGARKSHVMGTTGVLLGGVCLVIIPLLASDQVGNKLRLANQEFGSAARMLFGCDVETRCATIGFWCVGGMQRALRTYARPRPQTEEPRPTLTDNENKIRRKVEKAINPFFVKATYTLQMDIDEATEAKKHEATLAAYLKKQKIHA